MGTLTKTQIQNEVLAALANRDDISTRLDTILDLAQLRITRLHEWEELQQLATGSLSFTSTPSVDKFYTIPTNLRETYSFRVVDATDLSNNVKLSRRSVRAFDREITNAEAYATGLPSIYVQWKGRFEIWRIPDKVYTYEHRHSLWPASFASIGTGGVSDLDQKDDCIIALAVSWGFSTLRMLPEAGRWWTIYKDLIDAAIGEEKEKPDLDVLSAEEVARISGSNVEYWRDPFSRNTGVA